MSLTVSEGLQLVEGGAESTAVQKCLGLLVRDCNWWKEVQRAQLYRSVLTASEGLQLVKLR